MIMVTRQEPRLLPRHQRSSGDTHIADTPDADTSCTRYVRRGRRGSLDMAAQRGGPTLHDGARLCGRGEGADASALGWKSVLEDGLERHEGHRCLRPRRVVWALWCCALQYHASDPRDKRLVQSPLPPQPVLLVTCLEPQDLADRLQSDRILPPHEFH